MRRGYYSVLLFSFALACTAVQQCEPSFDEACCNATRIMPLGDSITVGTSRYLEPENYFGYRRDLYCSLVSSGYNVDFVGTQVNGAGFDSDHEGHSGTTASWLNQRLGSYLGQARPDVILYHIGTNDLWKEDYENYAEDVNRSLGIIYGFDPEVRVLLAEIILTASDSERNSRTRSYNDLLQDIAEEWSDAGYFIQVVDMESALTWFDMADNLHPNARGYSIMADVWLRNLNDMLERCEC